MNEYQLLSLWIHEIVYNHFKNEKTNYTEKLFLKISGFDRGSFEHILRMLEENIAFLDQYYKPTVRTITPVEGFEIFECREHETSTWLRNNTHANEALVLVINEVTSEAQSLENLFTIDEAYLLSSKGMDALFHVLSKSEGIYLQEIDTLRTFLVDMLYKVVDPQLKVLLSFVNSILNSDEMTVVTKIHHNLPELGMFRDSKLELKKSGTKRLRHNYHLSNLQSATSELDVSKLQEKLYAYMNKQEQHGYPDDLWNDVHPDAFINEANSFLSYQNKEFYKYELDVVEKVFHFKATTNLKTQLQDIYEQQGDKIPEDKKQEFLDGVEDVNKADNPDDIQAFTEEFEDVLEGNKPILKKLNRLVEKLRTPSEYEDLYEALTNSLVRMLSEYEGASKDIYFRLEVVSSKIHENVAKLLRVYLLNINSVIPRLSFNGESMHEEPDAEVNESIHFVLRMNVAGEEISHAKFKINSFHNLRLLTVISELENSAVVPYIININEEEEQVVNVRNDVYSKIDAYLRNNQYNSGDHFEVLERFLDSYTHLAQQLCRDGVFSLDPKMVIGIVEAFLEGSKESVTVASSIYQTIDLIGSIDFYEEAHVSGLPTERIVTILNPIRLINYIQRYRQLAENLESWIEDGAERLNNIEKLDEYVGHLVLQTKKLAPAYFTLKDSGYLLIEEYEALGEGRFLINTHVSHNISHLAEEVSNEVIKTVKNYIEVYPYAKDGLDLMLMYCNSVEVVTKVIDSIFKGTKVKKLNLAVHSQNAAKLHNDLNKWIEQKEEYSKPEAGKKVPKLELSVIAGNQMGEIQQQISKRMSDADLVILVDYFAQHEQIKYKFQHKNIVISDSWFLPTNKEPLNVNENIKRISFTSDSMPKVLWDFYQLQYTAYSKAAVQHDVAYVLENVITINQHYHSALLEFMHDRFNWVMILDRYLDRTLLQKATQKAQIIQYKAKTGKGGSLKLIVSSSKYVRKIIKQMDEADYHDRLRRKIMSILKVQEIDRNRVIEAIDTVKDISGALVLKVLGKGKFSHEMLATYLTTQYRGKENNVFSIWALCDELPWFASNQRRPDLILTKIADQDEQLHISFELIELKFVNHHIFDRERLDAVKQLKTGMSLYDRLFNFSNQHLDAGYWRDQLVDYIIERGAYLPEQVELIKRLQQVDLSDVNVKIEGYIDVYCYTDNLTGYNFERVDDGVYLDALEDGINNYNFSRSYVLKELGVEEVEVPSFDELKEDAIGIESNPISFFPRIEGAEDTTLDRDKEENLNLESNEEEEVPAEGDLTHETTEKIVSVKENNASDTTASGNSEEMKTVTLVVPDIKPIVNEAYPEQVAFSGLDIHHQRDTDSHDQLVQDLIRKLKIGFNQNGIHIVNERAIVGSSVIRITFKVPKDIPQAKVTNRSRDMQLWVELNNEPTVFINKDGINVDIIRENPDTIYFDEFMSAVRDQLQEQIKDTNLIAPLGLNPLNEVIHLDFASPDSPHLLTGGTSGSGKSVTLNSIILGMMCLYTPQQLQFVFIDPKQVEFSIYEGCQHTKDVVTDINAAVQALDVLVQEMENRYAKFKEQMVANLEEYREVASEEMPRIVIVFDEFADFMSQDKEISKQVENSILRLGQKARAAGIHLIICTQNPKADIINTNIRNNLGARLALRTADATASTIILDEAGAEKLAGKGDFLAKVYGRMERGKSPFLTAQLRRALLMYFKANN